MKNFPKYWMELPPLVRFQLHCFVIFMVGYLISKLP